MEEQITLEFDGGVAAIRAGRYWRGAAAADRTPLVTIGRYIGRRRIMWRVSRPDCRIAGGQKARATSVSIRGDSELIIKQMLANTA